MRRNVVVTLIAVASLVPFAVAAQQQHSAAMQGATKPAPANRSTAKKIANAMSAAPAELSRGATIISWRDSANGEPYAHLMVSATKTVTMGKGH